MRVWKQKLLIYVQSVKGVILKLFSTATLSRSARKALMRLGADITVAHKKRRIPTVSMAAPVENALA